MLNGIPGQLFGANTDQANFLIPSAVSPGLATIAVHAGGAELASGQATITAAGPGIFVLQGAEPAQPGAVENQDYSINGKANPASSGSVVQIFATGDGSFAAGAQVFFGDTPGQILFSGDLPQYPGLWQINAVLPAGLAGQIPVFLAAGNLTSNAVTIWVQ